MANKAIGSFFQTYNYGYALLLPLFFSAINVIEKISLKNILFFLLILANLLLAQSKSMYLCGGLGIMFAFLLPKNFTNLKRGFKTILLIFTILISLISCYFIFEKDIKQNLAYAITGMEAMSRGKSASVDERTRQINWAVDNNEVILIGNGIGKGTILLESLYALYYYRYGVIGIMMIFGLIANLVYCSYKNAKRAKGRSKNLYYALVLFYILSPLSLSSSCHQDQSKTSILFYGLSGLVFNRYAKNKLELIEDTKTDDDDNR